MNDQEMCDYLATELMGWKKEKTGTGGGKTYYGYFAPDVAVLETHWNPLESADDCLKCVRKIGARGLGTNYIKALLDDKVKFEGYHRSLILVQLDIYQILTLPLKTHCEAMIKVLEENEQLQSKGGG